MAITNTKRNVRRIAVASAAGLALIGAGACGTQQKLDTKPKPAATAPTPQPEQQPENAQPTPAPDPVPTANPDGKYSLNCDLNLSSDIYASDHLVAGGTVKNTGNVGIKVRVVAKFFFLTAEPTRLTKDVNLSVGEKERVSFKVPITTDQVDDYQSSPGYSSPGAGDRDCLARATIIDQFGAPHETA